MLLKPNLKPIIKVIIAVVALISAAPLCMPFCREHHQQQLNHDLVLAIKGQDTDRALALLRSGADAAVLQSDGRPIATGEVLTRGLSRLIHRGAVVTRPAPGSSNPGALELFYRAALDSEHGRHSAPSRIPPAEAVPIALVTAGCCTAAGEGGEYCLYGAVHYHHHNVVMHLLEGGVRFGASRGLTAFMEANADDALSLISHGANIDMRDADGDTALFHADTLKAVALLNAGARIEARNRLGQTPLLYNCVEDNDDGVLVLLARSANVSTRDLRGTTPLLAAAVHCRLQTIKALVHAGSDIHATKKDGTTALMYSLYNTDVHAFAWFMSQSPNINARGMGGNTALSLAEQLRDQAQAAGGPVNRYDKAIRELERRGAWL